MTDTPVEEVAQNEPAPPVQDELAPEPAPPEPGNCRWCGAWHEATEETDWLCDECQRYQDAMSCPVCGGLTRVSLLPAEHQPRVAEPKKKKGK